MTLYVGDGVICIDCGFTVQSVVEMAPGYERFEGSREADAKTFMSTWCRAFERRHAGHNVVVIPAAVVAVHKKPSFKPFPSTRKPSLKLVPSTRKPSLKLVPSTRKPS